MSRFPWWDTTLTIYNKYEDPQTRVITWYSTVIENCFWKDVGNNVILNDVSLDTNTLLARIPKDARFIEKYQWVDLPADAKAAHFTLGVGDLIIKGEVSDAVNEYVSGHRSSDLIQKYKALQGCMIIDKYGNNTGPGRCQQHYLVTGK